jgi:hypothetical protein
MSKDIYFGDTNNATAFAFACFKVSLKCPDKVTSIDILVIDMQKAQKASNANDRIVIA